MNILETLKELKGFWQYDGGKYLVEDEGKISDVYCNIDALTTRPGKLQEWIATFYKKFTWHNYIESNPTHICSPATGAITLGYELARQFGCRAIFTEPRYYMEPKEDESCGFCGTDQRDCRCENLIIRKSGQELKRFDIHDGATILLAEDVITTGESILSMMGAIIENCGDYESKRINVLPYVLCLINRHGFNNIKKNYEDDTGIKIISLADVQARTWDTLEQAKKSCPNVIEVINPKKDWNKLTKGE